jgi:tetratricopeptide (TPR) repeat protein
MRAVLVVSATLGFAAFSNTQAQCSAPTQKLANEQKYDEARADPQAALKRNASDDVALHCMGWIYLTEGKPGDAIDWFEKSVKVNDKSSMHHLWLANSLGEQASHANKLKLPFLARRIKSEFDRAAELDPRSIDAKHGLIQYYANAPGVMGGSMDKAKEQAREIAKLNAMRAHFEMASLLEHDKDFAGTEKEYTAAIASSPDSNVAYGVLANFYRRQKRYDEAVTTWDRLLKLKPDAMNPHINIGWNLALSGQNLDRAEREVRLWLSAPPKESTQANISFGHYLLGDIYQRRTKVAEARVEYQAALSINPKNVEAKKALDALK